MSETTKELIQKEQLIAFEFFVELCEEQTKEGRAFGLEQPQGSGLLKTKPGSRLLEMGAVDNLIHMCMHELRCPHSHKLIMKPTIVRATPGVIVNL